MSKKKKIELNIAGKTNDGKIVVSGVFPIYSSIGLPLQDILEILHQSNMVPDWQDFYDQAIEEGWKSDRTILKIQEAVGDIFGPAYGSEVEKRLNLTLLS
jgi:hypothetical protein